VRRAVALSVVFSTWLALALTSAATGSPGAAQTVKVAFLQGEQIGYVERPGSSLETAIKALLAGPTQAEVKRELTTQVPAGTPLRSVKLEGGVATIDLGEKFATGTTVESLSARVAQLVLTATRYPNVRSVRLLVKSGTPLGLFPGVVTLYPLTAKAVEAPNVPPPPSPAPPPSGDQSEQVRALQQRLDGLGFLTRDAVDGRAGPRTTSAVVAFQKWSGLARDGSAGPATLAAIANASRPTPVTRGTGHRVEVLLDRQLALVIDGDLVTRTLDVSTGKPGFETVTGSWRITRKEQRSWSVPYKVWLPWATYIFQGYAFHEYPDVPPQPASHGCVRIPAWDSEWLYGQIPLGTLVTVMGSSR
jgi:lipoprotein-anchoring transpeptidase ErfK/SrfK